MKINCDVVIIGAGLTGMTMACSLGNAGVSVFVIESTDMQKTLAKDSDGRTCAISNGSAKIFEDIGLWQQMQEEAGEILDIRVTDGDSPFFLHYDHKLIGDDPMGYIVENYHIRKSLFDRANELNNVTIIDNTKYTEIRRENSGVEVDLSNGDTVLSQLIIAADGKNSKLRQSADIKTVDWSYNQHGIVCTVRHEFTHDGVAQERFLPAGPFAVLPMKDQNMSSIVWTEKSDIAELFMKMSDEEFLEQISIRFDGYLGKLEVVGKRFSYPLGLTLAKEYTGKRLALIGDAAHAMHPIAGQGFNLGVRDVPVLTSLVANAKNLGFDLGSQDLLAQYEEQRKFDNVSLLVVTDALNRLFSNDIAPVKFARRIGMAAVNKVPALKKVFMKHAMGESELV